MITGRLTDRRRRPSTRCPGCAGTGSTGRRSKRSPCPSWARWPGSTPTRPSPTTSSGCSSPSRPSPARPACGGGRRPTGLRPWALLDSPLDPAAFVAEQVFYPSTDGTLVPMFLVRAAATTVGPDTPTLLSAYGGFAITSSPGFAPGLVAFCEAGGVYAIAGIRGGGEYGEDWHRAGMLAAQAAGVRRLPRRRRLAGGRGSDQPRTGWPSGAGRTAGCWWAPPSPSGRTCAGR